MTSANYLFDDLRTPPRVVRQPSLPSFRPHRLLQWLARRWEAACRRAEDPRRHVPRY